LLLHSFQRGWYTLTSLSGRAVKDKLQHGKEGKMTNAMIAMAVEGRGAAD
jgi:hypothetical protein